MDRMSLAEPGREQKAARVPTFEETYPRYEFSELVRLALLAGTWLVKGRRRVELRRRLGLSPRPLPGETIPAD